MNIVNAWLMPDYISIWLNVDAGNIVGNRVAGEFDLLELYPLKNGKLRVSKGAICNIRKDNLYNILEVYNKEFSEYNDSFKKYERG